MFQGPVGGPPPPLNEVRGILALGASSSSLSVRSITALAGRLFAFWAEDATDSSREERGGVLVDIANGFGGVAVTALDSCLAEESRASRISTRSSSSSAVDPEP
jgi:hypothetical protein